MSHSWIQLLRDSLAAEFRPRPAVATLANVRADGAPAARTVICRRVTRDGRLLFTSDARSHKNSDLRRDPRAELVFWLRQEREQFRLSGEVEVVSAGEARDELWAELSDMARALFVGPTPGAPFDRAAEFPGKLPATTPPPAHFELLILRPSVVEVLDLTPHPHDRRRWSASNGWREERLNP